MPRLSQTLRFLQSPSFRQAQSALIGQLAQCIVKHHKQLQFSNNRQLQFSKLKTVNNVLSFTISSSPRGEQSCVTDIDEARLYLQNTSRDKDDLEADSEVPDCHSKVRITSSPRFTKWSSIKCVVITSGLCCSVVSRAVRIQFFELRSFGSNQHEYSKLRREGPEHIFLSNKSRNLCASVCLLAFLFRSSNRLHAWRVCCYLDAVSHFGAIWTRSE